MKNIQIKVFDSILGSRIDRYLKKIYPLITQGVIQKILRLKKVKVNAKAVKNANTILKNDDILSISHDMSQYSVDDSITFNFENFDKRIKEVASNILTKYVIQDTQNILFINKPAGLSTQGGYNINVSIDHALKYLNYKQNKNFKLIHRLDKETSGIIMVAKNASTARYIGSLFKEGKIHKQYLAILQGIPTKKQGDIKSHISKFIDHNKKYIVVYNHDSSNTKYAFTRYKVLSTNKDKNISLVLFEPVTGRMHQIRHHANLLGCSILNDTKYYINSLHHTDLNSHLTNSQIFLHSFMLKIDIPNILIDEAKDDLMDIAKQNLLLHTGSVNQIENQIENPFCSSFNIDNFNQVDFKTLNIDRYHFSKTQHFMEVFASIPHYFRKIIKQYFRQQD